MKVAMPVTITTDLTRRELDYALRLWVPRSGDYIPLEERKEMHKTVYKKMVRLQQDIYRQESPEKHPQR